MASSYLGPESPRPMAVISESFQNRLCIPQYSEYEKYSFGPEYETKMYELVHKYLELDTRDRLCYVGDLKGSLAPFIQEKFCLLNPLTTVVPGHFHYLETSTQKMLPIRIAHVGAEEYFRQLVKNEVNDAFDKVLIKDSVQYFVNPTEMFTNINQILSKFGKTLIVHRPGHLNTLPYFNGAKKRLQDNDTPYMSIINDLQACNLDVQWDIHCLPVVMPKRKWLGMLKDNFPSQMEILSNTEIVSGMRELSEGVLKYEGEVVEFVDRLLFIVASQSLLETGFPKVQRFGADDSATYPRVNNLKLKMNITPDVKKYLTSENKKPQEEKSPFWN